MHCLYKRSFGTFAIPSWLEEDFYFGDDFLLLNVICERLHWIYNFSDIEHEMCRRVFLWVVFEGQIWSL